MPKGSKTNTGKASKGVLKGSARKGDLKLASVTIMVTPTDSTVWLNDLQMANSGSQLTGIKPGAYTLTVRHGGYRDQQLSIELKPGENDPISITLELMKGTLSVRPNVDGSSIDVRSIERNQSVGSYAGAIDNVEFPPGEYELTISKPGYQVTTRTLTIKPGGFVDIEPRIDPVPPAPTPTPRTVISSRSTVSVEGKYLVVSIVGSSGDTSRTSGTINVTVNRATNTAYVQGSLNGLPCQVSFVSFENVAEWSLAQSPGPSNGWAVVVVRVKPKDSKRPTSFAINWVLVQKSSADSELLPSDRFYEAVPIDKVLPAVPLAARSARVYGVVIVSVLIDEQGRVKSAKAIDGPALLRQSAESAARRWKFKPATRNGVPTQSTKNLTFKFEGY